MTNTIEFLQHASFAKILVKSLPCGLLITDQQGRVRSANRSLGKTLGISNRAIVGKPIDEALGFNDELKCAGNCDSTENCSSCNVRNLCFAAIKSNQVQKTRTSLRTLNNGQTAFADFIISAVPFSFDNQQFSYLFIENIPAISTIRLPTRQSGVKVIVGNHPTIKRLIQIIRQVARTNITVLIEGETGTGKELVAQAIHKLSSRSNNFFVPINCGALPEGLLETELFGHVKGAFTGAIRNKKGRFELADGGTLFFDEIGDLSFTKQVHLLRVLEDGKFQPIGSEKTLQSDVRIVCATNKNMQKEVSSGRFRKDLYYRLSAMPIKIPPLRERRSDIPLLAKHFLALYGRAFFHKNAVLSSKTVSMLMFYDWPGNVRELQNVIQFALAKCPGNLIEPCHLMPHLIQTSHPSVNEVIKVKHRRPALRTEAVIEALNKTNGNKMKAAGLLGISRSTLYRFLAKKEDI